MSRIAFSVLLACVGHGVLSPLGAQAWNDPAALALVARAAAGRARVLGPAGLAAYRAEAHGLVLFLQQVGAGFPDPPVLAKADELSVEVYWQAPGRSKQVIRFWRDTTLSPATLQYHRDHLGIVTNDFGQAIRLGDGDEVRDLRHPLAPDGPSWYDYALGNQVEIRTQGGTLMVREVATRPRHADDPGVVGTLYLEVRTAALVRFRFSFTAAAYRDPTVEDITVDLENALVDGAWLPWRQQIEIRRQQALLDFSARGIIRAEWMITNHETNPILPSGRMEGPSVDGRVTPGGVDGSGRDWAEVLDGQASSSEDPLAPARRDAARLLASRFLDGLPATRWSVGGLSDVARVTRVEGLALGAGVTLGIGGGRLRLRPALRFATTGSRLRGVLRVEWPGAGPDLPVSLTVGREVRDIADMPILSPFVRSLLAQEAGTDYGDWVEVDHVTLSTVVPAGPGRVRLEVGVEQPRSLETIATPSRGSFRANPSLGGSVQPFARGVFHAPGVRLGLESGTGNGAWARLSAEVLRDVRLGGTSFRLSFQTGQATPATPSYRGFALGGWGTLLGEGFRAWGGRGMALARIEWRMAIPGPVLHIGPYGSVGGEIRVAPFAAFGGTWNSMGEVPWQPSRGVRPVIGVTLDLFSGLLHAETGVALRGGNVGVSVDVGRAWWGLL